MTTLSTWCHAPDIPDIKDTLNMKTWQFTGQYQHSKLCQAKILFGMKFFVFDLSRETIQQYNIISTEDDIFPVFDISWCAMFWSLQSVE